MVLIEGDRTVVRIAIWQEFSESRIATCNFSKIRKIKTFIGYVYTVFTANVVMSIICD